LPAAAGGGEFVPGMRGVEETPDEGLGKDMAPRWLKGLPGSSTLVPPKARQCNEQGARSNHGHQVDG
jgi:hypothetical protein